LLRTIEKTDIPRLTLRISEIWKAQLRAISWYYFENKLDVHDETLSDWKALVVGRMRFGKAIASSRNSCWGFPSASTNSD
jgi:uncharacterized membrane protein